MISYLMAYFGLIWRAHMPRLQSNDMDLPEVQFSFFSDQYNPFHALDTDIRKQFDWLLFPFYFSSLLDLICADLQAQSCHRSQLLNREFNQYKGTSLSYTEINLSLLV